MGCTRKNPADKMPWLEGEIRKCKEKRNEKDGSQTNDIWNTREPGMWSQCTYVNIEKMDAKSIPVVEDERGFHTRESLGDFWGLWHR